MPYRQHVVIIGGGFGGLEAAKKFKNEDVAVTLIDRTNHHLFQPLLYQVATAGMSSPAIAAPIRHIFRGQANLNVIYGEVTAIDLKRKIVSIGKTGDYDYDTLIVASGATHSYFGNDHWAQYAPGLKTLDDAHEIRRRVLLAYEYAERTSNPKEQQAWLSFAVIGAGPTGVEMAGTLAEIAYKTLRDEFRNIELDRVRITLVEGSDRVLAAYPPDLSAKAQKQLHALGVVVKTNSQVSDINADGIVIGKENPEFLQARTVIWAAGVAASPLGKQLGVPLDRAGRVIVSSDMTVPGYPDVYIIGDLAACIDANDNTVPGVSPAAKQMGRCAAGNILRKMNGEAPVPFAYKDYGSLATIGRHSAIAAVGKVKLSGFPAWLFWLFVHIYFLIGFRNRLTVFIDWAWAYWTYERNARIIIEHRKH
ncbi:MAG TPA: NAD(P)/FAD-dependent oxidoreductase [Rhodocyclaceae bacterium]|jgi:NADH dehydrogenase|nr:NAD(P)/FAD-dependent oxidoreductase [Rhodocyclaceae bacterium]